MVGSGTALPGLNFKVVNIQLDSVFMRKILLHPLMHLFVSKTITSPFIHANVGLAW